VKKSRFSEEKIIAVVTQAEAGVKLAGLARYANVGMHMAAKELREGMAKVGVS
jgi:hypothetical protein